MDIYSGLLILYFIFFLGLAIKNLKWAIYLVIFGLPSYLIRFEVSGLPMTVLEGMILILFLVWLVKTFKHLNIKTFKHLITNCKLRIKNYPPIGYIPLLNRKNSSGKWRNELRYLFLFIGLFLVMATISMFAGQELRVAAGIWKAYFIEPILFLIVFVSVLKKEDLKNIFYIFSLSVFVLSVIAVYQKITGSLIPNPFWAVEETRRVTSVFEYPNALALFAAPVIIMLIGYIVYSIKYQVLNITKKINIKNLLVVGCWILIIGAALAAIYFTCSKGAMLAILAGIIFYAIFYKGARKYFTGLLAGVLVLSCFYVFINGLPNLKGASTIEGGDSVTTRLEMWGESWQMLKERPILGAGLAGYQQAVEPYHQKDYIEIYLYPHNIFLNFWSEIGLLGLIGFLLIMGWFYKKGFELMRIKNLLLHCYIIILLAGMTTLLAHGFIDVPYFKNDLSVLFWIMVGMMVILNKEKVGEIKENGV